MTLQKPVQHKHLGASKVNLKPSVSGALIACVDVFYSFQKTSTEGVSLTVSCSFLISALAEHFNDILFGLK